MWCLIREALSLKKHMPIADICGYLTSWSSYQDWKKANPTAKDVMEELMEK
jgi:hypothetical protein